MCAEPAGDRLCFSCEAPCQAGEPAAGTPAVGCYQQTPPAQRKETVGTQQRRCDGPAPAYQPRAGPVTLTPFLTEAPPCPGESLRHHRPGSLRNRRIQSSAAEMKGRKGNIFKRMKNPFLHPPAHQLATLLVLAGWCRFCWHPSPLSL